MKIEFTKTAKVNRVSFKKGDTLNVSSSLYEKLVNVDKTAKKTDNKKVEDKKVEAKDS